MSDFLSLITAVPGLISDWTGSTSDPYKKKKEQITSALGDTTNPLYQQLYGQYRQQGAQNLGAGLAEVQRQNRLSNRMGRTPLLSSDRGGEQMFRQLMQGYQGLGTQADQQTRQNLQGQLGNYTSMTPTTAKANSQKLDFFQGIQDLLKGGTVKKPQAESNNLSDLLKSLGY